MCAESFGRILDHADIIFPGDLHDRFHIRHVSENMNHNESSYDLSLIGKMSVSKLAFILTELTELHWIQAEAVIAVDKDRRGELILHRIYCGNKGKRRN